MDFCFLQAKQHFEVSISHKFQFFNSSRGRGVLTVEIKRAKAIDPIATLNSNENLQLQI